MDTDRIELRLRCLELAIRSYSEPFDATDRDIVAEARRYLDFAEEKASAEIGSADA